MMAARDSAPLIIAVMLLVFISAVWFSSGTLVGAAIVPSRTVATCTETDGGNEPTSQGRVTIVLRDGQKRWAEDRCVNPRTLHEYNCPLDNSPNYERRIVTCDCDDGACPD